MFGLIFFIIKRGIKNFMLISNPLKVFQNSTKEKRKQTKLTNMSNKKVQISVMFMLITLLCAFFKTFATDLKSAWNSAFFKGTVHKIENFFGSDFECCTISLLVLLKY